MSLREKSNNWRTPLEKMLKRAGIPTWSPLFNCLRSSAEIDIARRFGVVAATEWVGNSVQVAMKHYLRTTADDFKRASDFAPKDAPVVAQTEANGAEVCTHDAPMPATANPEKHGKPNKKRAFEENSEARSMDDIGLEPTTSTMSTWYHTPNTPVFIGLSSYRVARFACFLTRKGSAKGSRTPRCF